MPKKTPKKITLENLAKKIDEGLKKAERHTSQKIDEKIDQLALAVKNGFDEVDRRFNGVDRRFNGVDKRFDENTKQHQQIFDRMDNLEQGQEEIKLKLTAKLSS